MDGDGVGVVVGRSGGGVHQCDEVIDACMKDAEIEMAQRGSREDVPRPRGQRESVERTDGEVGEDLLHEFHGEAGERHGGEQERNTVGR